MFVGSSQQLRDSQKVKASPEKVKEPLVMMGTDFS